MRVELILEAIDRATRPIQAVRQALAGVEAANRASTAAAPVKAMTQMRGAASAALAPMRALSIATTAYGGAARGVSARAEATAKALAGVNAAAQAGASPFTALTGAAGAHFAQIGRSTAALDAWRASATTAGVQAQHSAMQAARAMRAASSPVRGTFGQVSAAFAPMRRAPAWRASVPALPPPPPPPPPTRQERREKTLEKARAARSDRQSQLVGALGIAASVAAPMTKAVAAWNAYEDILTDVGLKADLSGPKLAALGEKARAQARALNMSGTDILKGVDQLAAGGMAVADAVASFPALTKASVATKASMVDLSTTAVALINNLKVAPAEIGAALDAMAQTGKDGQFELKDMAKYFPRIGALYSTMGQYGLNAVHDLAAALQIMRKNVGSAGEAVTNLEDLLAKMTMKPAQKAFKAAGIDVVKEMAEAQKTGRILETMYELIGKATGGDLSKIQDIFGDKQARAGATALMQHFPELIRLRNSAKNAGGVVDRDFATRMQLGVEKTRALQVATAELWTTLGQALAPAYAQRVEQLTAIVNRVEAWVKANPELAAGIAQAATATAALLVVSAALGLAFATLRVGLLAPLVWLGRLAGMGAAGAASVGLLARAASLLALPFRIAWWAVSGLFGGLASGIASGIAAVGGWRVALGIALGRLGALFGLLLSPLRLAAQAVMMFGAALMTTPVGWVAAAVAALAAAAYLIYANWGAIGPWFANLWASIKAAFVNGWNGLGAWLSGLGGRMTSAMSNAWASVKQWFGSLSWPSFGWPALPSLGDVFAAARDALSSGWASVKTWFGSLSWPPFDWPTLPSPGDVFAAARGVLSSGWANVQTWFGSLSWPSFAWPQLPPMPDIFGPVLTALETGWGKVRPALEAIATGAGKVIDTISTSLSKAASIVFGPSAADVKATSEQAAAAKAAIEALKPAAVAAVSEVGASFREASFAAQGLAMMTTLANGLREGRAAVVTAAREAVEVIGSAMALSAPAPAPAQGVAAAPAPVVAPLAPKPLPSGPAAPPPTVPALPKPDLSGVLAAVEAAKAAIEALPPAASQGVAAIGAIFAAANFASHGQAMMTTLAAGIRAGTNSAVAAARAAVQQIRDHLPHSPAKVGPLSDLDRVQFGQTLATAIAAGAPRAVAAARSLAAGVAATVPAAPMPAFAFAQGVAAPSSPSLREPSFARPDPQMGGGASVRGGGSTAIHLTFAPTLNGAGGQAGDVLGRLKSASYDLVEMIRAELDRRERAKH